MATLDLIPPVPDLILIHQYLDKRNDPDGRPLTVITVSQGH